MRFLNASPIVFAATMVAIGLLGLAHLDVVGIWDSVPKSWPAQGMIARLCSIISLVTGLGLLVRRTAVAAAGALLVYLLLWITVVKVPVILRMPFVGASWESCGETAALAAAAWVLFARLAAGWNRRLPKFAVGERGLLIGRSLYGLALISFGLGHFAYLKATADLVPDWLPAHTALAFTTGLSYIAAGMALLAGVFARLAATLSAVQIGLFTLLVWLPLVAAGSADAATWSETVISWALTMSGWVVADSYRGLPWFPSPASS
jgi:uncharacterized membrane protein